MNDSSDFMPSVATLGNLEDITNLFDDPMYRSRLHNDFPVEIFQLLKESTAYQSTVKDLALKELKTPNGYGMLCLTHNPHSDYMWLNYGDNSSGFVVGFSAEFLLPSDGVLSRVIYTDQPVDSFLADYDVKIFFRKTSKWNNEEEWRYLHPLSQCIEDGIDGNAYPLYFLAFDPKAVHSIYFRPECTVKAALSELIVSDPLFAHVQLVEL